jgi:hypothetical protein
MKATTIALDPEADRLLSEAARDRGISRAEFIRQHLTLVLEQAAGIRSRGVQACSAPCGSGATSANYSVAAGNTRALICDTGALLDYLVDRGRPEESCAKEVS